MTQKLEFAGSTSTRTPEAAPKTTSLTTQWIEEGTAFMESTRQAAVVDDPRAREDAEPFDVIVIGAGQAGLSVGYHLAQRHARFVILDAHARVGDAWRQRWDSLRLFSTARFDGLDGMPFPGDAHRFPSKDEMGDYLESYVKRFDLPVRTGMRVERVTRDGDRYVVMAGGKRLVANHVVVAMSSYQKPRIPDFARELDPSIVQLHSTDYRRPSQLPGGDVLIVGAGNSGAEIAMDLLKPERRVILSGKIPGQVPFNVRKKWVRMLILPVVFRFLVHRVLSMDTPIGRKARPSFLGGTPLIRTRAGDLAAAGVGRVGRVIGVRDGKPMLADGTVLDVASVVWSTGFTLAAEWLERPVFDAHGEPIQARGIARDEPGLYFVGQHFLHSVSSAMIHGVGRDARRVAEAIAARLGARAAA
jgi:putative flavoprotein involved in K+ transport